MHPNHTFVSDLHRAAVDYALRGWPVFPILPGEKKPATEHGFHDATTDVEQINAWWTANPDYNIAFSPHQVGLSVVDLDGPEATTAWEGLQLVHGDVPATYEVATPRKGGRHLYFLGELPPTQSKLADHVDTRGRGSYALLPPSRTADGVYRQATDLTAAPLPEWVATAASAKRERAKAAVQAADLPVNVERARAHLRTVKPAVEGQMGNKQTFVVAADMANLGVSEETAQQLMAEIYNPRCIPPWDLDELETIVSNGFNYAQNEAGSWATEPAAQVFAGEVLGKLLAESAAQPASKPRFTFQTLEDRANLPPPSWLIPDMLPDKAVSILYGPGGGGKTFVALRLGLDLAKQGKRVGYVMGEGGTGPDQRVKAWRLAEDTHGELPFAIVDEMPLAANQDVMEEFVRQAVEFKPDLLIIDTVAWFALGLNENDASDSMKVAQSLTWLTRDLNCAVLAIHHTGKDATRGMRGSDALLFGVNAALEAETDNGIVSVYARRQKDAEIRKAPWHWEIKSLGPSAVAMPISGDEKRKRTERDDLFSPPRVGRLLLDMGAVGEGEAVTSHALAQSILQHSTDAPVEIEEAQLRVKQIEKQLGRMAKWKLQPYAIGEGDALRWMMPIATP